MRRRLRTLLNRIQPPSWSWDYPLPESSIRGRTLIVDGWLAAWPPNGEIVVQVGSTISATSALRHLRPDVATAQNLPDDAVGFHFEIDLRAVDVPKPVNVQLAVREPGAPLKILETRTVRLVDRGLLDYELGFRMGEERGVPLHREHIYTSGPPVSDFDPQMLAIVRRFAVSPILDLGCGAGPYALALMGDGYSVHGVEYEHHPARIARERGVSLARSDARRLPFRDRTFDSVIAVEVLEHIESPELAVAEISRVTRNRLIVSVPNAAAIPHLCPFDVVPWHILERTHVNFFSATSLQQLLQRGFRDVQVGYYQRFPIAGAPPIHKQLFAIATDPLHG